MSKRNGKRDCAADLLRRSATGERRLLKRERRAERELAEARAELGDEEARLERAQARVERRRADVSAAEARLRERQAARAIGPAAAVVGENAVAPASTGDGAAGEEAISGDAAKAAAKRPRRGKAAGDGGAPVAATMGVPNV